MAPADSANMATEAYLSKLKQLENRLDGIRKDVSVFDSGGQLITQWMLEAQRLVLPAKANFYLEMRLRDQFGWYLEKSRFNARRERAWFWAIFAVEFFAVAYAALQAWRLWSFDAVSVIAALSATFIAWMQTKRFSDLALSYGIAAGDLRRIEAAQRNISAQSDVDGLVTEVETAVSREHSMWLARRLS